MATFADAAPAIAAFGRRAVIGAEMAANEMADVFRSGVRGEMRVGHFLHTRTPSPRGAPPAWISGDLKNSLVNEPALPVGPASFLSRSGPTVRYSRIQELGGTMTAHSPKGMRWQEPPGVWHRSMEHDLPERPYMLPAHDRMIADGTLHDAAVAAFAAAIG